MTREGREEDPREDRAGAMATERIDSESQLLLRMFATIAWLAGGFVPVHLLVYALTGLTTFAYVALVSASITAIAIACRPMARRGEVERATLLFCIVLLVVVGVLWWLMPWAYVFVAMASLLPPAIGLPHLQGRRLTALTIPSMLLFGASGAYGALNPFDPRVPLLGRITMTTLVPIAVAFLIVLTLAQAAHRQRTMLARAQQELARRKQATEQLTRTEEHLRQSQKMEAVGRLAGGIAHDFNNLLSVVLSYAALLLRRLPADEPMRAELEEIKNAGERAAHLTKQLLAFSRQQVIEPQVLDLNQVIGGMDAMITRLMGEDIDVKTELSPTIGSVKADPGHLEQVIMNLAVNARDAMPAGGSFTIATADTRVDEAEAGGDLGLAPGPYVKLSIRDTGIGMDERTRSRMFEPFFTTKEKGRGTGLGLSTVFGIVKQSGGGIFVDTTLGQGTTFDIYLPRSEAAASTRRAPAPIASLRGAETILLAEDQDQLRAVARSMLESSGYRVLEGRDGHDALRVAEAHPGTIDLLLTDVVMPQMGGRELARRVQPLRPAMRVLYMSGYTPDAIVQHRVLEPGIVLLQKPITPESLLRKVREVLDAPAPAAAPAPA